MPWRSSPPKFVRGWWWWVVVWWLDVELQRLETNTSCNNISLSSPIKLRCCPDLLVLIALLVMLGCHGGGDIVYGGIWPKSRSEWQEGYVPSDGDAG
jgi:hypothetical protein